MNMVLILMISAKLVNLDLVKIKVLWNKDYDIIISFYDATNKVWSSDSNYTVDLVMWQKFGNSSISVTEVIVTQILKQFNQKNHFFGGMVLVQVH